MRVTYCHFFPETIIRVTTSKVRIWIKMKEKHASINNQSLNKTGFEGLHMFPRIEDAFLPEDKRSGNSI